MRIEMKSSRSQGPPRPWMESSMMVATSFFDRCTASPPVSCAIKLTGTATTKPTTKRVQRSLARLRMRPVGSGSSSCSRACRLTPPRRSPRRTAPERENRPGRAQLVVNLGRARVPRSRDCGLRHLHRDKKRRRPVGENGSPLVAYAPEAMAQAAGSAVSLGEENRAPRGL